MAVRPNAREHWSLENKCVGDTTLGDTSCYLVYSAFKNGNKLVSITK